MVANDLGDHEVKKLLGKIGVQLRVCSKLAQASNLGLFPRRVCWGKIVCRLVEADGLRTFEAFCQQMDQRGIKIVDAISQSQQFRVAHDKPLVGTAEHIR